MLSNFIPCINHPSDIIVFDWNGIHDDVTVTQKYPYYHV